ncbi:multidrug ABC transporter ATPase [Cnuibacter sp. UC19_7]|uniref:multidrug ABC transporter ATPase n=1 Tax=Cnuibacter sp. UC19_7 TaxID=3350166 RepID=UPI00366C61C6
MSDDERQPASRLQRTLGFMIVAVIGLSVLCFFAIIIATAVGVHDFTPAPWPVIGLLPVIGLPIGFVLIFVLLIISVRARGRENRGGR